MRSVDSCQRDAILYQAALMGAPIAVKWDR